MAKDKNTFAKHQRETLKRQKTQAKQERRRKRRERADDSETRVVSSDGSTRVGAIVQ